MKQKLFWLDLAVCSLWLLAILGGRHWWWASPPSLLLLAAAAARTTFAFVFRRGDKRAWIPLAVLAVLMILPVCAGGDLGIQPFSTIFFALTGIDYSPAARAVILIFVAAWIWLLPLVAYIVTLLRGKLVRTDISLADTFGAILWHDTRARAYSALMLATITVLYAGLAMYAPMCVFACFAAPALCYYILARYYGIRARKLGLMVAAMVVFYFAQPTTGLLRIALLAASLAAVAYMCSRFYRERKELLLSVAATVFLGVLLPSMAIGYNQYTCLNYGRAGYFPLKGYRGIFYVRSSEGFGLRNRYGLLVEPRYGWPMPHRNNWLAWGDELELLRNGYCTLYDVLNNSFRQDDAINHELQDSICAVVNRHLDDFNYDRDDRIEVRVREYATGKEISHVKAEKSGEYTDYDYSPETYIPTDTCAEKPGEFVADTLVSLTEGKNPVFESRRQVLSYSRDVEPNGVPAYNILILAAREKMPAQKELETLAEKIGELLESPGK